MAAGTSAPRDSRFARPVATHGAREMLRVARALGEGGPEVARLGERERQGLTTMFKRMGFLIIAGALSSAATARGKKIEPPDLPLTAAVDTTVERVQQTIGRDTARLLRVFHDLHRLSRRASIAELYAAHLLSGELAELGFDLEPGRNRREVVAILKNGDGPTLVYRADTGSDIVTDPELNRAVDALGQVVDPDAGIQHRCGRDAHVAWLLGMARAVTTLRSEWSGTLVLVAEPTRFVEGNVPAMGPRKYGAGNGPVPDFMIALRAAPTPLGSVLGVRGVRRPGADSVDVSIGQIGAHGDWTSVEGTSRVRLAASQVSGLPENVRFGYFLIGVSDRTTVADTSLTDASAFYDVDDSFRMDLSAVSLGAKLATVAVLELLHKPTPKPAKPKPRPAETLDLSLRQY